jgi:putative addiction module CopG family antidote
MTIHLSKDLEQFVHDAVRAGRYASEDDVIHDALSRLKQSTPEDAQTLASPTGLTEAESANQDVQRKLFNAGLLTEIKPPLRDFTPYLDRKPVPIEGEPLSETIIHERR